MTLLGRTRLGTLLVAIVAGISWGPAPAVAQSFPDRPIKVVIGFPAGSGADILCRYFTDRMAVLAGVAFVVENKPGATGNIGADAVAKAKPDGYVLMMGASSTLAGNPYIYKDLTWDPVKDFEPVASFATLGYAFAIAADNPAKTVSGFTAQMKAKGGKATFGFGNTSGLAASSLYAHEAGFPVTSVAYKSNPQAVSDTAGGQIDYVFSDAVFAIGQEKAGKVRILAVTSPSRMQSLPAVPTMREVGLGNATMSPWWALYAPAKTPKDIVAKLEGWINKVTSAAETKDFLLKQGVEPLPGTPGSTRRLLADTLAEWERIVKVVKFDPQ
jgi:tripartite-type tricarboxylate transporter receptor subunit TctC